MKKSSWVRLLKKVHEDDRGAVSLETILIIGAIAIPILIFIKVWAWPKIKGYFQEGMDELLEEDPSGGTGP